MYDHNNKPTRYAARGMQLSRLVFKKFGPERGAISKAASAAAVHQGNFSQMLRGNINTPQKYLNRLAELPDYVEPAPRHIWPDKISGIYRTYIRVPEKLYEKIIDLEMCMHDGRKPIKRVLEHTDIEAVLIHLVTYAHEKMEPNLKHFRALANEAERNLPKDTRTFDEREADLKRSLEPYHDETLNEDEQEPDPLS